MEKGFLLNGKHYELKGTCNHQDHAGVGAALPDALQYFRVAKLKEMGCNAIRTSHNPPTPELLEACDRLGMLVMDENRLLGSDEENLRRWKGQIQRDRNHPSVAIWSIANEEFRVQSTPTGKRVAETMQDLVQRLDPTRPVTYAAPVGNEFQGINSIIEVRGWNYHIGTNNMDAYHAAHPAQPNVGTEQASTVSTRGIYANDKTRGYVSAYDDGRAAMVQHRREMVELFRGAPVALRRASSGPVSIIAASPRLTAGRASTRTSASWTPAVSPRTTSIITSRGGGPTRVAPAAALELAGQGRPGH